MPKTKKLDMIQKNKKNRHAKKKTLDFLKTKQTNMLKMTMLDILKKATPQKCKKKAC